MQAGWQGCVPTLREDPSMAMGESQIKPMTLLKGEAYLVWDEAAWVTPPGPVVTE